MKRIIIVLYLILPILVKSQDNKGVKFSNARNWQEALAEAKKTHKPIFVDAYATWCIPCKMMDKEVYSDPQVAAYVNANFIAIKVQMDSTKSDNDFVRGWHADADKWKPFIPSYPSYLFFTPEGKYFGREGGYRKPADFVALLKTVVDPKGSYLAELEAFKAGALSKARLLKLAFTAKKNKQDSIALQVAAAYKMQYVDSASIDSLLNPKADEFTATFVDLFSFEDPIIHYMYEHSEETDKRFHRWPKYSQNMIDYIINRDYIYNIITPNKKPIAGNPVWKVLEKKITKDFNSKIARRLILNAKIYWAYKDKNWNEAVRLEFQKIENYGMDTTGMGRVGVNNMIYEVVFKQITDTALLRKAVYLMKQIVDLDNYDTHARLDTYASVLYKLGNKQEAIKIEKDALRLVEQKNDIENIKFYTGIISKMKAGHPIWKE